MVPSNIRLNSVVAIEVPDGVNCDGARNYMSSRFEVEISGAFGLNIVYIGKMGEQCRAPNLCRVLYALGVAFAKEGGLCRCQCRHGSTRRLYVPLCL